MSRGLVDIMGEQLASLLIGLGLGALTLLFFLGFIYLFSAIARRRGR